MHLLCLLLKGKSTGLKNNKIKEKINKMQLGVCHQFINKEVIIQITLSLLALWIKINILDILLKWALFFLPILSHSENENLLEATIVSHSGDNREVNMILNNFSITTNMTL